MIERVAVSDTNIFIDLMSAGGLSAFFSLPWEIHTTAMIIGEFNEPEQLKEINTYISEGKLIIDEVHEEDLEKIEQQASGHSHRISRPDYSAYHICLLKGCMLLTGDRRLRLRAEENGVEVHGVIYIFEQIVSKGLMLPNEVMPLVENLFSNNRRLPKKELEKLRNKWSSSKDI